MDRETFLSYCELVPAGQALRVPCCATDNSMRISNEPYGIRGYCFRCKSNPFVPHGVRNIALLREAREAAYMVPGGTSIELPADLQTIESRQHGAGWLLKSSVGLSTAKHYGIGWSEKLQRVILPVYLKSQLVFWQGRAVDPALKPKYLNVWGRDSTSTLFHSDQKTILPSAQPLIDTVVVTEDILSAIRVGRVSSAISLLGTSFGPEKATSIANQASAVVLWLDPDPAGKAATIKLRRKLCLMGLKVSTVSTSFDKDPKCYSNSEIQDILNETTCSQD